MFSPLIERIRKRRAFADPEELNYTNQITLLNAIYSRNLTNSNINYSAFNNGLENFLPLQQNPEYFETTFNCKQFQGNCSEYKPRITDDIKKPKLSFSIEALIGSK